VKFSVIGPTYPFRGGIAHYTTLLVKHLRVSHSVSFYSYRRQYPRWLFPGNTAKDPSNDILHVDCEYLLDSLNPLTWWRVYWRIRAEAPDVLILQWWTPFWTPMLVAMTNWVKTFKRTQQTKILFVCHHIVPPEGGPFDLNLAQFALRRGDFFIVHNEYDYITLHKHLPGKVVRLTSHPTYDMLVSVPQDSRQARQQLGLDTDVPVVLFFGFVRRYKGVGSLLDAMPLVLQQRRVKLLIVGEFWEEARIYEEQIARLGLKEHVLIIPRYVPNEEVAVYFSAADLVVVPYVETATSGVVRLAFGFNKPVVGTNVGGLSEVLEDGETGYLVPPGDSTALARAIIRFFQENVGSRFAERIALEKTERSWPRLIRLIERMVDEG
jgi:glycosyltransferase involved in cell wall biosynthesis